MTTKAKVKIPESFGFKTLSFENEDAWLEARKGKITGTKLGGLITLRGNGIKKGFWELCAEGLALPPDEENCMERGRRLENEAITLLEKDLGKKFDTSLVMWVSEQDERIGISPDAFNGVAEAAEVKCKKSSIHIEAWVTKQIPKEFDWQKLQYFIVNPKLEKLHFCFYDPRVLAKPFFYLTVERKDVQEDVDKYLKEELEIIKRVEEIINQLTF